MSARRPYTDGGLEVEDEKVDTLGKTGGVEETVTDVKHDQIENLVEKLGARHDGLAPLDDIEYVIDKVDTLTVEECTKILEEILAEHEWDYNFAQTQREKLLALLRGPTELQSTEEWELQLKTETAINKFYSPYPEVRAVTTPTDDVNMPCETIRAHLLGYLWAVIAQFVNSLFNSRFPQIIITSAVTQILLYPCGKFVALVLPDWGFTARGQRISLNPGPWTYKEQMLSTIIINVSVMSAYCFWNIQTQTVFYHDKWLTPAYKILLLLSTQLMGLGFAGLLRRFVVYPTETFWPSVLPTVALNRALLVPEKQETLHGWSISRYKFFFLAFGGMFVYFWLPDYLFPAISIFSWMTWIAPNNFKLALVTGGQFGLGYNPISSFDWNVFATYMYPLAYPFFSFAQQYLGMFLSGFIILGIYLNNVKWTAYLPANVAGIYDNTGQDYNISRVLSSAGVLNETEYKAYSPAFYSAAQIVSYGAFFAFYPLTFVFIILDTWRPISRAFRQMFVAAYLQIKRICTSTASACSALVRGNFREAGSHIYNMMNDETSVYDGFDDPFTNMMRNYAEVPDWWFFSIALLSFIFAIIILTQYPDLGTPVWTIFFVIGLNIVFLIPMTYLYAISGTTEGLNVITELVVGYALPGHPEALMFVKAFGYNINGQADTYISDQKMGFYAKIPPRAMYRGQLIGSVLSAFVAYGVVQFVDNDIPGICTTDQPSKFNCEGGSLVYYSSSVIWGLIGPKRIFSQIYPGLKYCFLLGFLLAIVWWVAKRYGGVAHAKVQSVLPSAIFKPLDLVLFRPISWLKHVHPALVFNGAIFWAPTGLTYYTSGLYFSFGFMYYLRRYKTAWWEKYNYVLSAAFTGGVAFSGVIIFFAVQYHPKPLSWWGTNILDKGVDGYGGQSAYITQLPARGYFGPDSWY